MTLQDIITAVSTNLGNRASGQIGNQSVDTVVLGAVNSALIQCIKEADPDHYNRECSLTLSSPDRVYDYPTQDSNGDPIRIKDIVWYRTSYTDSGSSVHVKRLPYRKFVEYTQDWDQEDSGIPSIWAPRNSQIYIDKVPSSDITMTLFVEVFPQKLTTANLNVALPLDEEWSMALEAYATHFCYIKLQQIQLSEYWFSIFEREKRQTIRTQRKSDGRAQEQGSGGYSGMNPVNNPFINSWN